MKIGLDIDDVTAEFIDSLIKFYNYSNSKNLKKEQFKSYNFWDVWGGNREEAVKIVHDFHNSEHFENIIPRTDAIDSISKLMSKDELFIITSRPLNFKQKTEKWFDKHFANKKFNIFFSGDFHGGAKSKLEICKELKINLLFEDSPKYALDCASDGIKVILFDQPWNQNISHNNIIRVKNWKEAMKAFKNIEKTIS